MPRTESTIDRISGTSFILIGPRNSSLENLLKNERSNPRPRWSDRGYAYHSRRSHGGINDASPRRRQPVIHRTTLAPDTHRRLRSPAVKQSPHLASVDDAFRSRATSRAIVRRRFRAQPATAAPPRASKIAPSLKIHQQIPAKIIGRASFKIDPRKHLGHPASQLTISNGSNFAINAVHDKTVTGTQPPHHRSRRYLASIQSST